MHILQLKEQTSDQAPYKEKHLKIGEPITTVENIILQKLETQKLCIRTVKVEDAKK